MLYMLYVLLGLLALASMYFAFFTTHRYNSSHAVTVGYSMFFGAALITGIYKQAGVVFYPDQAHIFVEMDDFIFRIAALLLVAWVIGMFVADYIQSRTKKKAGQTQTAPSQ